MPIHHAVLALLSDRESYGYELRGAFTEAIGPQWGDFNIGHLYQILERLLRDGLATRREVAQPVRPDKYVYTITEAGRAELERWLQAPFIRQGGYRDDFFLKLLAASRLGEAQLAEVLRIQREAYLGELASLADLHEQHRDEPLVSLLVDAAIRHTRANLEVIEEAERNRKSLAGTEQTPVAPARPRTEAEATG